MGYFSLLFNMGTGKNVNACNHVCTLHTTILLYYTILYYTILLLQFSCMQRMVNHATPSTVKAVNISHSGGSVTGQRLGLNVMVPQPCRYIWYLKQVMAGFPCMKNQELRNQVLFWNVTLNNITEKPSAFLGSCSAACLNICNPKYSTYGNICMFLAMLFYIYVGFVI